MDAFRGTPGAWHVEAIVGTAVFSVGGEMVAHKVKNRADVVAIAEVPALIAALLAVENREPFAHCAVHDLVHKLRAGGAI